MKKQQKYIYFDHAATTPVLPEVAGVIKDCLLKNFGNASEPHMPGRKAKELLENSRQVIAKNICALPSEIVFTSGGTESDNMAISGAVEANKKKGDHIISTKIEHPAVMMPLKIMERRGFKVTYLPVDKYGMIDPHDIKKAITDKTILVSVMHANNIFGTIQPVEEIGRILKQKGIIFHTDAVQSFANIKTSVDDLGVDLLSISGHKIYGPKGIGALYIRKKTRFFPLIFGGSQESGRRPGTENIPGIAGLARAAEINCRMLEDKIKNLTSMREYLIRGILERIEGARLNGHPSRRLPGNCNFSFEHVEGEAMVLRLDRAGFAVSSGSACSSGSSKPSGPLVAMGLSNQEAYSSLRITLGFENSYEEIDHFIYILEGVIRDLRAISPF